MTYPQDRLTKRWDEMGAGIGLFSELPCPG